MFTLMIALGLIVVMLILGLGSSVLWMRPASRQQDSIRPIATIESGSMTLDSESANAA